MSLVLTVKRIRQTVEKQMKTVNYIKELKRRHSTLCGHSIRRNTLENTVSSDAFGWISVSRTSRNALSAWHYPDKNSQRSESPILVCDDDITVNAYLRGA